MYTQYKCITTISKKNLDKIRNYSRQLSVILRKKLAGMAYNAINVKYKTICDRQKFKPAQDETSDVVNTIRRMA